VVLAGRRGLLVSWIFKVAAIVFCCVCVRSVYQVIPGDLDSVMTSLRQTDEKYQDASVSLASVLCGIVRIGQIYQPKEDSVCVCHTLVC